MQLPERYRDFDLRVWPFSIPVDAAGEIRFPLLSSYPPYGFLPLQLFEAGNGDLCGFYWPIGREAHAPLLCDTYHDRWYLEPEALDLEGLARLRVLKGWEPEDEDVALLADTLAVSLLSPPDEPLALHEVPLEIVPDSPSVLNAHAQVALEAGDLAEAERLAREALRWCPEYTDARFLLVKTLRRCRRIPEAVPEMIETFCSPFCFGRGQRDCLRWLQQMPDTVDGAQPDDPIWAHRHAITMATGVKRNDDFPLYEEIIAECLRRGLGERAVRLRYHVSELYSAETVSFRERYGYTEDEHFRRLQGELDAAGLYARAAALRRSL